MNTHSPVASGTHGVSTLPAAGRHAPCPEGEGFSTNTRSGNKWKENANRKTRVHLVLIAVLSLPKAWRNIHLRFNLTWAGVVRDLTNIKGQRHFPLAVDFLIFYAIPQQVCLNVENTVQVMIVGCCLTAMLRFRGQGIVSLRLLISKTCLQFWTPGSFPRLSAIKFNNRSNSANCGGPLELKDDDT